MHVLALIIQAATCGKNLDSIIMLRLCSASEHIIIMVKIILAYSKRTYKTEILFLVTLTTLLSPWVGKSTQLCSLLYTVQYKTKQEKILAKKLHQKLSDNIIF